jgi:molecular chaperone GrpE
VTEPNDWNDEQPEFVEAEESTQGSNGEAPEAAPAAEQTLEERLAQAEARAAEYLDGWQRERAEFANARKRLERSRAEARQNATIELIVGLLPVLDDFERALNNVPEVIAGDDWFNGVSLIYRKLQVILERENIERIASVGEPFDPNFHEAVLQEASDDYASGVVVRELQSGYRLDNRVIRPAMVVVAA